MPTAKMVPNDNRMDGSSSPTLVVGSGTAISDHGNAGGNKSSNDADGSKNNSANNNIKLI